MASAQAEHERQVADHRWPTRLASPAVRYIVAYLLLLFALLTLEQVCLALAVIHVHMTMTSSSGVFRIDGQTLRLPWKQEPTGLLLVYTPATVREIQFDGSDSINNFDQNPDAMARLAQSPYYQLQAWMRETSTYSVWRNVSVRVSDADRVISQATLTPGATTLNLPRAPTVDVSADLTRPEVQSHLTLLCGTQPCAELLLDRNDRYALVRNVGADATTSDEQRVYFPTQPLPYLAEVVYTVTQTALWSLGVFAALLALTLALGAFLRSQGAFLTTESRSVTVNLPNGSPDAPRQDGPPGWLRRRFDGWDVAAALIAGGSLILMLVVALAQFQGEPHILDASAYLFQAKIFASGRLSAPLPDALDAFQGPFMVAANGRWFSQYAPGTSALLALGVLVHAPWLVEPGLDALALWGVYKIGRMLFGPGTGLLAAGLGALSPFFTYIAAAYLSHGTALFFVVYFLLFLLRFERSHRGRDLLMAASFGVGLLLTRELSAALVLTLASGYIVATGWRALWADRERTLPALASALAVLMVGVGVYLAYNLLQTGDPLTTPRALFSAADRYGFGPGIGFYGQHTLAAGLVNLDQLLTSLLITLYGWPFYLTLAIIPFAFARRPSALRWEGLCLLLAGALTLAQVGYFYHGIYLGPRYLYETLPFLFLLTARGLLALAPLLARVVGVASASLGAGQRRVAGRLVVSALAIVLLGCSLVFYWPRQFELRTSYAGLPYWEPVDTAAVYRFHAANAIVVTDNWYVYTYVLFPLNDPDLRDPTIYAYAPTALTQQELREHYPTRAVYAMVLDGRGAPTFIPL